MHAYIHTCIHTYINKYITDAGVQLKYSKSVCLSSCVSCMHAQAVNNDLFLIETVIDLNSGKLSATVKVEASTAPEATAAPLLAVLREGFESV